MRPLPYVPEKSEWSVSRSHVIHDHAPEQDGLYSIIGGKLTTYRSLAEETVGIVFGKLGKKPPRCVTESLVFPGARVADWALFRSELLKSSGLDAARVDRLVDLYGSRAAEIVAFAAGDAELLAPLDNQSGVIGAEIVFTAIHEFARTLTDVLTRRTMAGFGGVCGAALVERAANLLSDRLGWDRARRDREIAAYWTYADHYVRPGDKAPGSRQSASVA